MKTLIASSIAVIATTFSFADIEAELTCSTPQFENYFEAQTALANDDLSAAQTVTNSLLELAKEKGCPLEGKECCAAELEAASKIAKTTDIATARRAFKRWSDALLAKLEDSGLAEGPVYKMHCPMAFGNTGGTWLQNSSDLRNPYYGAMMLKCGMIQKEYESKPESQSSHQANSHGAHQPSE